MNMDPSKMDEETLKKLNGSDYSKETYETVQELLEKRNFICK